MNLLLPTSIFFWEKVNTPSPGIATPCSERERGRERERERDQYYCTIYTKNRGIAIIAAKDGQV